MLLNELVFPLPQLAGCGAFFQPMLRGVEASVSKAGFDLLIHTTQTYLENANHHPLREHNTDGLLAFFDSLDTKELTRLHMIGFLVVLLHQHPPDSLNIPVVTIENEVGARQIVEHLIEIHYCQQIIFLLTTSHICACSRRTGW
jgi:DNA-binding LacI/PurR family transcriptional regulator